ncbi:SDR family NAD(P)-dependent oxidoreductase [Planosporangium thailandense]|uniref:SDR family NAD(P)-dependent oxidoreductase n=1 Tax=Planosporangium thailandense TaxID=765197 RepID=A0ABX0Y5L2_9ACTN|nr:oxidoreductase [Planosporangium thailandense]NJC73711.1 SDR family NAD(P)-dependent oxidoreductase [Planosporangium thailandense]
MTVALITGCSSGIGRATALRLARRGMTVYATARRPETLDELAAAGCRTLALDVTDEASMRAAVTAIEKAHGGIDVLVNNAGYGEYGMIEEVSLDRVRTQFETNVFGLARLCQLVLPGMRARGGGRIVNVGSMGGRLVFPGGGYYHASKYAVEAMSDALRFEVAPFGVQVSVIEPGLIRTGFGDTAAGTLARAADRTGPYASLRAAVDAQMAAGYRSRLLAAPAEAVAATVERAVRARRMRTRYVVTPAAKLLVHTRRLLGARLFDGYLRLQFHGA